MEGSTTDHRAQLGSCWSKVTEKALAGSVRWVQPPSQPPAKKVCSVVTRAWVDPVLDVVEVADVVDVVVGAGVEVGELDEGEPLPDGFGRVDDDAALGWGDREQPAAADASATSDAMVTLIETDLTARG